MDDLDSKIIDKQEKALLMKHNKGCWLKTACHVFTQLSQMSLMPSKSSTASPSPSPKNQRMKKKLKVNCIDDSEDYP